MDLVFDYPYAAFGVTHKTEDFRMSVLSVDYHITGRLTDFLLNPENHRTGAVDDFKTQMPELLKGLRRLSVRTHKNSLAFSGRHLIQIFVIKLDKAHCSEPFQFGVVVDYGSERIEDAARMLTEKALSASDSADDARTETGCTVNLNVNHI